MKIRLESKITEVTSLLLLLKNGQSIDWDAYLTEVALLVVDINENKRKYFSTECDVFFKELRFLLSGLKLRGVMVSLPIITRVC
jgi:hypothetical protein